MACRLPEWDIEILLSWRPDVRATDLWRDRFIYIAEPQNVVNIIGMDGSTYNITLNITLNMPYDRLVFMTCYGDKLYLVYYRNGKYLIGYMWLNATNTTLHVLGEYEWINFKEEGLIRKDNIIYTGGLIVYMNNDTVKTLYPRLRGKFQFLSPNIRFSVEVSTDSMRILDIDNEKIIFDVELGGSGD